MENISLTGLHIYPVKSMRGTDLERAKLQTRGLAGDRRWMLVDGDGQFLTQRQIPRMSLIHPRLSGDSMTLSMQGHADLKLPAEWQEGPAREVRVWGDRCQALSADQEANDWLSRVLETEVHLVYMPDVSARQVDEDYARTGDITSFADGFPLLLISEASLQDLNSRLEAALPMHRFRPNLVVKGCAPYAEDDWKRIRIGSLMFDVVKPCSRCIIPTIDPETGIPAADREPLKTLMRYRRRDNKVYFGQNLIHRGFGDLSIGDTVEVLE